MAMKRLSGYLIERNIKMYLVECIKPKSSHKFEAIGVKELSITPVKLDDLKT